MTWCSRTNGPCFLVGKKLDSVGRMERGTNCVNNVCVTRAFFIIFNCAYQNGNKAKMQSWAKANYSHEPPRTLATATAEEVPRAQ